MGDVVSVGCSTIDWSGCNAREFFVAGGHISALIVGPLLSCAEEALDTGRVGKQGIVKSFERLISLGRFRWDL